MLDWFPQEPPRDLGDLFDRLKRLVRSMPDPKVMTELPGGSPIAITAGATGTLVPHGNKGAPSAVFAQVVGDSAIAAEVTVGAISPTHVRIYATANVNVQLLVWK